MCFDPILKNPAYCQNVNFKFNSRTILYGDEAGKHRSTERERRPGCAEEMALSWNGEGQRALGGSGSRVTGQKNFGGGRCHLQVCSLWSQSGKHQGGYYVDLSPEASWILQAQGVASSQLLCPGFLSPPEVFGLLAV